MSVNEISGSNDMDKQLRTAEQGVLKAKATYSLRKQIIENVLMTDPILKAVHSGANATSAERYGLPESAELHTNST